MAIIKSFAPFQNLTNFEVFEVDNSPNSEYFRITELNETLTGGKNAFLIEGSEHLKETTEVKIEILDVNGNPIYFEPGKGTPDYYEGNSTLVSMHVYDDTPIGIGKITILGELKTFVGEDTITDVPLDWQGIYNVKWERDIQINKTLANETIVRFYKRPIINISEIVKPIFNKTINDSEATGSINGFPLQPSAGQRLSEWRAGTNYLLQRTSGTWDVDVDGNRITITSGSSTNIVHSGNILEVLSDTDLIIDSPYVDSSGDVTNFSNFTGSVAYQDIQNETIGETSITGSFAKIDITQLKTFVGDVARVKIFRKSRNAVGDFAFVQEAKLESQELLRDVTTAANTEVFFGKFTDDILSNYWISSSNDHPITTDSSQLSRAAHIDYNNSAGGTQQLITSQSINVSKDVEYTLEFKTLLSGSIDTGKSVRAFLSSSDFTQDFLTVSGSNIYQSKQDVSQNIIAENSGSAKLVFEVNGSDWFISNVSLRNAQDTSFSPDEFTIIQDIPRKTATETFDFRFEFYDVNNNFIPVNVTATKEFDGGNDFPTSGKLFTFESDRNAFRFSSGSIGNPPFQQIQFKTSQNNLTGSVTYASAAFDVDGTYIDPSSYTGTYPGTLTSVTPAGSIITIANFSGSDNTVTVGSIVYTASLDSLQEFETIFRLEDGDNAPQLVVTSDANQFIYEPTTLSPKPSSQSITVRAQRKNLASLVTPITINSGSNKPGLTYVDTSNGIDTYTISATAFSESFASNDFDSVTYQFTGSDVFGNEQSDEITLSKVINFDAVSIILTNEATSFQAKSTGEILGGLVPSSGSVQMFIGKNQISHDDESGGRNKNTFNITSSVGDNVTPTDTTPNTADYSISAFETAKDSGSLTLTIDYLAGDNTTTQSFEKVVSYTKAKKAVPTVLTKVSPSTQTINSSSLGYETPQTMEVVIQEGGDEYTFDGSLSGGGDSNAQKFNITGLFVDSGSISNSNEILTFGSLTSSFNSIIGSASLAYVDSEGTYVTGKKVRFDLSVSKIGVDGVNGASGSNAKAVSLSSDKYAIVYDGDGNLHPSNQNFTLSGSAQNFNTPEFQFLSGGAVIHDFATTSEVVISSSGYPSAGTSIIYEVRTREQGGSYEGVFDNIDVFAVQSGSDAFTVFLTNEAHVFSATSESTVTSDLADGSFEVRFFRGAEQYNFGTSGKSYGVSATSSSIELAQSTNSNQRKFTPTSISGDSGSASITITDNNTSQTFDKQYSFTLSKEGLVGERGADGANGANGSNAKAVSLSSTKYAVVYDGDGNLFPANQNFNLSGSAQNFSNPEFQFLSGSDVLHDFASTSEVTISSSGYPLAGGSTLYEVRVRENGGTYDGVFDNIDVFGVQSGSAAFTTFLTNEAHVFSAQSTGEVTSTFSDGNFETRFFRGSTQFTYDGSSPYADNSYRLANVTETNITSSQSTNSNQRLFTITGINSGSDNGTITLDLIDNNTGTTFEKTYTFSKSKKGVPVTTLSASPQAQSVTSGSGGIGTPTNVTIVANEGGSDYTYTTGTVTANKFKITGVTNGTNNNDGTITPDTPTNSTAVEGGVTASYTNSEGTEFTGKTIPFSVGVTGLGDVGPAGSAGTDALAIKLTASQYVVLYDGAGSKTAVAIVLTGTAQNFTSPEYRFLENGVERQTWSTTNTYTIPDSQEAAANSADLWKVEVREGSSGTYDAFDETNIYGVQDGSDGTNGADAYTVLLTNEAHTLPTTNAGTVTYTGSGTSVIVYKGTTELDGVTSGTPGSGEFKVTATATNITAGSQTSTGNPVVFANASSISADTAQISFSINIENSVTVTKIQSFGKSVQGDDGGAGDPGKRTATGMVHYNAASTTAPTGPDDGTTTFTFSTGVMSGMRSGWQMGAPTYASGNTNKYWYATFTAEEDTAGGGTSTNSNNDFGSVTQAIGFSGLVSFTSANNVSDGSNTLSFGAAGSTLINGDNISTGRIISTNYVTGSGDGFTTTGVEFDLDDNNFAAEEFFISQGSANFSGSIAGGNISIGDGAFTVTNAGVLNAQSALISGSIFSEGGTIGGFSIFERELSNTDRTIQLISTTNPVIKLQDSSNNDKIVLSTESQLTPVGGTFSGVTLGINGTTQNSYSNLISQTGMSLGHTNSTLLQSTGTATRFPSSGTIPSAADGLTLTAAIAIDEHSSLNPIGKATYTPSPGYYFTGGNLSINYGVKVYKNGSTLIQTVTKFQSINVAPGSYGATELETSNGSETCNFSFAVESGAYYEFKTFVSYVSTYGTFTTSYFNSHTLRTTTKTPEIQTSGTTATLSAAGAVSFAEINQGGLQVITSATQLVRSDFNSSDALSVTGSISATGNITAFASSDERLKTNILPIVQPLEKINKISGVEFDWVEGFEEVHNFEGHDVGVIAQQVEPILPEITRLNKINGYWGVKYEKLTPLLIEGIKELSKKVEELENKLKDKE